MMFEFPGGRNSVENGPGNSIQQEQGCKGGLGGSWGRILSHLGVILGPQICPEEGPKTSSILRQFVEGPKEGQAVFFWSHLGVILGPNIGP